MCQSHTHRYGRRFGNREDWIRRLESHQRDLEQRLADVADLLKRLKDKDEDAPRTEPVNV
jgi:hypothetical protein